MHIKLQWIHSWRKSKGCFWPLKRCLGVLRNNLGLQRRFSTFATADWPWGGQGLQEGQLWDSERHEGSQATFDQGQMQWDRWGDHLIGNHKAFHLLKTSPMRACKNCSQTNLQIDNKPDYGLAGALLNKPSATESPRKSTSSMAISTVILSTLWRTSIEYGMRGYKMCYRHSMWKKALYTPSRW